MGFYAAHGRGNDDAALFDGAADVGSVACTFGDFGAVDGSAGGDFGGVNVTRFTRRADGGASGDVSEDKATPHHGARALPDDLSPQPIANSTGCIQNGLCRSQNINLRNGSKGVPARYHALHLPIIQNSVVRNARQHILFNGILSTWIMEDIQPLTPRF